MICLKKLIDVIFLYGIRNDTSNENIFIFQCEFCDIDIVVLT